MSRTAKIDLPEAVRQAFVQAGRKGGKKSREMTSHQDRVRWGQMGGRPRKQAGK